MTSVRTLAFAALCALPLAAAAQWMYIDKDGRKVLSDQAPPPDVPAKNILRQPGVRSTAAVQAAPAAAAASAAEAPKAAGSAPKLSVKDKDLEEKRKQVAAADEEKKKAEAEKLAQAMALNCQKARENKATMESGQRVSRINAKGEREVMDDKQRAAEVARMNDVIASDCKQ
jgi:ubiquitin